MRALLLGVLLALAPAALGMSVAINKAVINGLCPGYTLAIKPAGSGTLVITNGTANATCVSSGTDWRTYTLLNFCSGKKFSATTDANGNLLISCV